MAMTKKNLLALLEDWPDETEIHVEAKPGGVTEIRLCAFGRAEALLDKDTGILAVGPVVFNPKN
ncbi:hypothetical protein [Geothrix campi]|uniref:hypothetical protein n=1 Tax=Geothrix campi TaxID=2966450 RepID=UPI0021473D0B|nr:hypothetical protein [Geothrix sp. SG10]